jgi:hypothetical protein
MSKLRSTPVLFALVASLASVGAAAQMNIPNPLVEPPKPKAVPAGSDAGPLPPIPGMNKPAPGAQPGAYSPTPPMGMLEMPKENPVRDAKAQFASYYVSAIIGVEAVLRRAANAGSATATPLPPGAPMPGQPLGQSSTAGRGGGRSDSIVVKDGDPIDFVGDGVLIPKVTAGRVIVYYVANASGKLNEKHGARHPVVFIGEVETGGGSAASAIVLEKKDADYRSAVQSVKTSGGGNGTPAQPSSPAAPAAAPSGGPY